MLHLLLPMLCAATAFETITSQNIAGLLSEKSKAAFTALSSADQYQALLEIQDLGMTAADAATLGFAGNQVCRGCL